MMMMMMCACFNQVEDADNAKTLNNSNDTDGKRFHVIHTVNISVHCFFFIFKLKRSNILTTLNDIHFAADCTENLQLSDETFREI